VLGSVAIVEVNISMSVDGFVTGPNINEHPGLGEGGEILYGWLAEGDSQEVQWLLLGEGGLTTYPPICAEVPVGHPAIGIAPER
jgi:hypothetical protein